MKLRIEGMKEVNILNNLHFTFILVINYGELSPLFNI